MAEHRSHEDQQLVRFGIIGCAGIAYKLSRAIGLAPNATVVAVGSRSLDKCRKFLDQNHLSPAQVAAYGSYEEVLDDPRVDAVYVPLPTSLHVQWAVAAAGKGKHVLLEKPTALCASDLDKILDACEAAGVQFMDSTMWMHHPRTAKMKELLLDPDRFGQLKTVHSIFSFSADPDFLQNDIRVKPDLDSLGVLGDAGWYCIRSILWAANYELPKTAIGLHGAVRNEAGVIISCGSSLLWEDGKVATFYCSFLSHLTTELIAIGARGTLRWIIPFEESSAPFTFASNTKKKTHQQKLRERYEDGDPEVGLLGEPSGKFDYYVTYRMPDCKMMHPIQSNEDFPPLDFDKDHGFTDLVTGWKPIPSTHVVNTDLPQEVLMVKEFSRLAGSVRDSASQPDKTWPMITRKTQLVLDAVKVSIDKGYEPVDILG